MCTKGIPFLICLTVVAAAMGQSYLFTAYLEVGKLVSKPVMLEFGFLKPKIGKLWFQIPLVLLLSFVCWMFLTIGNRVYQKYIQTRMISKLESQLALKQQLTAQSTHFAQLVYRHLQACSADLTPGYTQQFTLLFLKDVSKRIQLLWSKDQLSLSEFHQYFDELVAENELNVRIYHQLSAGSIQIPVPAAFRMLQVFSLYLMQRLNPQGATVFSLDSEYKSNRHLLIRFYAMSRENALTRTHSHHFLKEVLETKMIDGITIDVIENLEYGDTMVADIPLNTNGV